ncbi:sn-glycerol-3-phosphate ABC transporter ATP-binding protein UgpC [uncultured Helcococcus sp.]|uniref:ABC transporter ATP-binding protein n=1 Tax=uncultured Helcococcus sp. TaxID=1072508 RepID=UPI00262AEB24|nr:sn-glycerol-3-phosphate ABC transporter ATP-binding protein UgpC [uncultured Helcococcus sp.]
MAGLKLKNIYKVYDGGVTAVKDFNLEIEDKEFVVFVGPSGCGKSTTLRMVAGLEEISQGELYIDDKLVNDVEPKDRDIAMVFQNYALYPQMTVRENMSYALRLAKRPIDEINKKVEEAARILDLEQYLDRKPKALSGGQRQRVALGRAIVRNPKVFLMDEPLSNLDAKLRVQMRAEISKLHERLGTTFIYVTHDQTEAMTMGDKIVVMSMGEIQQADTPHNVYFHPANMFVAGFIGSPQMNFIEGKVRKNGDSYTAEIFGKEVHIDENHGKVLEEKGYLDKEIIIGIRPEHIYDDLRPTKIPLSAKVSFIERLGSEKLLYLNIDDDHELQAKLVTDTEFDRGMDVNLYIDESKLHFFDNKTEKNILI